MELIWYYPASKTLVSYTKYSRGHFENEYIICFLWEQLWLFLKTNCGRRVLNFVWGFLSPELEGRQCVGDAGANIKTLLFFLSGILLLFECQQARVNYRVRNWPNLWKRKGPGNSTLHLPTRGSFPHVGHVRPSGFVCECHVVQMFASKIWWCYAWG